MPARFWHLFWNTDPTKLRLSRDGSYIAGRMLEAEDLDAFAWVMNHASEADVAKATSRRGFNPRAKALATRWRRADVAVTRDTLRYFIDALSLNRSWEDLGLELNKSIVQRQPAIPEAFLARMIQELN